MIERERKTRGDSDTEARAWAAKLAESERKRDSYLEMFGGGHDPGRAQWILPDESSTMIC